MPENSQQLAAILSTDAVAYSRHMSRDEVRTDAVVRKALQDMAEVVKNHRGHIITEQGDGFISIFDSATKSVECALALSGLVDDQKYTIGDETLTFRTGMCLGEVIVRDGSAFGDAVNIAKRLEQLAQPGQIVVSKSLAEQAVGRTLAGFEYLGERSLKNIANRVATYRLARTVEASARWPSPREVPTDRLELGHPVLAVLPIDDFSAEKDKSWLCDCITEEIIHRTSKFREVPVISRNSVFAIRENNWTAQRIAAELQANYLLVGSLRAAGRQVRLNVQLVDPNDARPVWSESFAGDLDNPFSLQDAIGEAVVGHIVGRIEAAEYQRVRGPRPSGTAYEAIARARQFYWQGGSEALDEAERICRTCIANEPLYPSAWTLLSRISNTRWLFGWTDNKTEAMGEAEAAARRALALDAGDARAHCELGLVMIFQRKHRLALQAFERALSINPNDPDIIAEYADALQYVGRPEEGLALMRRAMALNPYYPDWYLWTLADIYFALDQLDECVSTVQQMANPLPGSRLLAASFALTGKLDEARIAANGVLMIDHNFSVRAWTRKLPYSSAQPIEQFAEGLRLAGLPD